MSPAVKHETLIAHDQGIDLFGSKGSRDAGPIGEAAAPVAL
jgi:hypothetical protein